MPTGGSAGQRGQRRQADQRAQRDRGHWGVPAVRWLAAIMKGTIARSPIPRMSRIASRCSLRSSSCSSAERWCSQRAAQARAAASAAGRNPAPVAPPADGWAGARQSASRRDRGLPSVRLRRPERAPAGRPGRSRPRRRAVRTPAEPPARFQAKSPACYRASWQMPGPAPYRQATTRVANKKVTVDHATVSPPIPLGARSHPGTAVRDGTDAVRGASGVNRGRTCRRSSRSSGRTLTWRCCRRGPRG